MLKTKQKSITRYVNLNEKKYRLWISMDKKYGFALLDPE